MPHSDRLPLLVAFDLDYTLWDLWVDTHVTSPLKRKGTEINRVYDRYNTAMGFFPDVPKILYDLNQSKVHVAIASRTSAIKTARQALNELLIPNGTAPPKAAIEFCGTIEIYPGSKLAHFKEIHSKTGIPYSEMVFYDDEPRNLEVQTKLGVTFVLVKNGLDNATFQSGLESWRKKLPAVAVE